MKPTNCKEISEAFVKAMQREDLHTREAARKLNLNPCYVSMLINPGTWDSLSNAAWTRFQEWCLSNLPITEFHIPEGEPIWVPPVKKEETKVVDKKFPAIPKFKDKPSVHKVEKEPKPPKFDYSFLHNKKLSKKEAESELINFIGIEVEKRLHTFSLLPQSISAIPMPDLTKLKVGLDIEINLVLNGQKVRLQ
jgi:hypothetical protein